MQYWVVIPAIVAALALVSGGLDAMGALTGAIMGYMILFQQDWRWLSLLLLFFVFGMAATMYKYKAKKRDKLAQKRRTAENVLGNSLAALIFAMQGNIYGFTASLATATADTMSSEIGVLSKTDPVSILDLKTRVPKGENGGVSLLGNTAMFIGSMAIAATTLLLFNDWALAWLTLWGGVFGCIIDSVIGATIENKGKIGNHTVNFLATLIGGLFAAVIAAYI